MPRSTREWSKRKLDEACNAIDWAGTHLNQVHEVYNKPHPEIGEPLMAVMKALSACQDKIREIGKTY